jgi:hypothetical protein
VISGRCRDAITLRIHLEPEAGSRDVSDPVEWPWGELRGSGGGSLTSRLRYYPQLFGRQKTPPVLSSQQATLVVQLPLARGFSARLITDAYGRWRRLSTGNAWDLR